MSNGPQSDVRVEKFFEDVDKLYVHAEWNVWRKALADLTSILLESNLDFDILQKFFEFRRIPQKGVNGSMGSTVEFIENNSQIIDQILKYLEDKTKNNYSINQTRFIDILSNINYQKYGIEESQQSRVMNSIMNVLNDVDTRPLWKLWIWYSIMEIRGINNLREVLEISQLCEDIRVHPGIMMKLFECIGESGKEDYLDFLFDYEAQNYGNNENEKIMTAVVQAIGKIGGDKARNYLIIGFDEGKTPGKGVYARSLAGIHDDYVIDYFVKLALERDFPSGPIEELRRINSLLSNEILRSLMAEKRKKYVGRKVAAAIALMKNSDLEAIRILIPFALRGSLSRRTKSDQAPMAAREAICKNENPENLNILLQEQNENWYMIREELGKIADRELPDPYLSWEEKAKMDDYITRFIDHLDSKQLNPRLRDMLGHLDTAAVLAACHHIGINRIQGFEDNLWELSTHFDKNISSQASIALTKLGDNRIIDVIRKEINDGTIKSHMSAIKILTIGKKVSTIEELVLLSKLYIHSKYAMKLIINSWVEMEIDAPEHIHSIGVVLGKLERDLRKENYNRNAYKYWDEIEKLASFGIEKIVKQRRKLTFENFDAEKQKEDERIMQLKDVESRKKHKELREQRANNIKNHGLKVSDSELELILDVIHGETATISKDKVKSLSNELISTILDSKYAGDFKKSFDEIKERDDIWPNLLHRIELRINGHL